MNTMIAAGLLIISTVVSFPSMAEESDIRTALLINATPDHKVIIAAIGTDANANTGAIMIKVSKITKSTISNGTTNRKILNLSTGRSTTANVGSMGIY